MSIYLEHLRYHWIPYCTSPNGRNFASNFGGVYNSTRTMAWGTSPLPVGTSKPEVGYFAMKPTILRYQILPWAIKKWFRVYWITFQYSWNRKYWWEPEVFLNFNFWLHICNKHMICYISYDSKFYCWFTIIKIFEIRPRNFFKSFFV